MIIYEKENKLNVSFENSINETPDIQIGKDGDKTQILVDGQESSGSGGANVLTLYMGTKNSAPWAYKDPERAVEYETYDEAESALNGADVIKLHAPNDSGDIIFPSLVATDGLTAYVNILFAGLGNSVSVMRVYLFNTPDDPVS